MRWAPLSLPNDHLIIFPHFPLDTVFKGPFYEVNSPKPALRIRKKKEPAGFSLWSLNPFGKLNQREIAIWRILIGFLLSLSSETWLRFKKRFCRGFPFCSPTLLGKLSRWETAIWGSLKQLQGGQNTRGLREACSVKRIPFLLCVFQDLQKG